MCEACPAMINHNEPGAPTEAEVERILDQRIHRRLATDAAYRYAANAEEQAAREDEIEREEGRRFEREERERLARRSNAAHLHAMQQGSLPRDIAD